MKATILLVEDDAQIRRFLRATLEADPMLEIESTIDCEFDGNGNLISPFAPIEETVGAH